MVAPGTGPSSSRTMVCAGIPESASKCSRVPAISSNIFKLASKPIVAGYDFRPIKNGQTGSRIAWWTVFTKASSPDRITPNTAPARYCLNVLATRCFFLFAVIGTRRMSLWRAPMVCRAVSTVPGQSYGCRCAGQT